MYKAALKAGYAEKSARSSASRLLTKAHIKDAIAKYAKEAAERTDLDASYVLEGLMKNAELGQVLGFDGKPLGLAASTSALGLLGKHLRLFIDRTQIEMGDGVREFLNEVVTILDDEVKSDKERGRIAVRLAELAAKN